MGLDIAAPHVIGHRFLTRLVSFHCRLKSETVTPSSPEFGKRYNAKIEDEFHGDSGPVRDIYFSGYTAVIICCFWLFLAQTVPQ